MEYRYKPTTHGLEAMAAYMALGTKPFNITRVAFGSGKVDEGTNLADVHELLEYVADGAVAGRGHQNSRVNLTIQYANSEHKEVKTFLLSEFIVYVEDPETGEETDLLYGTMGDYRYPVPTYNPAYPPSIFNFPLVLVLSDEIQVIISAPAGLPTYDDLESEIRKHSEDPDAHADLLKQYVRAGDPGEPGSALILDDNGKIPDTALPDDIVRTGEDGKIDSSILPDEVFQQRNGGPAFITTIPTSAWKADPDGPCAYRAEVACEDSTEAHIPYVSLDGPSAETARSCGFCDFAEAADGVLRFWAESIPSGDIIARAVLFGPGGATGSGQTYRFGHGLKQAGNLVSVDTADGFDGDNTLPITAAAVQTSVGNIETILETI